MPSLPEKIQALVLSDMDKGLEVISTATPQATPGSAVIEVLSANVLAYSNALYAGQMGFTLFTPMTIGGGAIGRISTVGSDASVLKPGQLVLVEPTIRGRDDPYNSQILVGIHGGQNDGSKALMQEEWRNGVYSEYAKVPLENVYPLNEDILFKEHGDTATDLAYMFRQLVPMGGLYKMGVQTGDRVIIAPATGQFGGAGVEVARALGADVIAAARNEEVLKEMKTKIEAAGKTGGSLNIVKLSGDPMKDAQALQAFGPVDKYLDFAPTPAGKSTHFIACLMALRKGGTATFMGGVLDNLEIPYPLILYQELTIQGNFMYGRDAIKKLIGMVESGKLALGEKAGISLKGAFPLDQWKQAFDMAAKESSWGAQVAMAPNKK